MSKYIKLNKKDKLNNIKEQDKEISLRVILIVILIILFLMLLIIEKFEAKYKDDIIEELEYETLYILANKK